MMLAFWDIFIGTLFIIVCMLLIVVVLLQKGRGGGLGAAFGGAGGAFGTRTGDVFTWVTVVLTGVFLLLAVGTAILFQQETGKVAATFFSPMSKPIDAKISVILKCPTKGATIYWTLDGSEPTDKSDVYEGPVEVHPGATLRARAYRAGWDASEVVTAEYPPIKAPPPPPVVSPEPIIVPATAPATSPATN